MNRNILIWIAIGALLIAATGTGVFLMSRGIRNNNPGNIRHGGSQWQGMSAIQADDEYVQFDDPIYGIRAMAKLLRNYQIRYGLDTVRTIITRWAPPIENITSAYIENVSKITGLGPDERFNITDYMVPMVKAIIKHENGSQPYSTAQIDRGISLA